MKRLTQLFIFLVAFQSVYTNAQINCTQLFSHPSRQELLLTELENIELAIIERLGHERDRSRQTTFATKLAELQLLINDTLDTPASDQQQLINIDLALNEIRRAVEPQNLEPQKPEALTLQNDYVRLQVSMAIQADVDLANLPVYLRLRFKEFIAELELLESPTELDRNWELQRANMRNLLQKPGHTVKLNSTYRVLFTLEPARTILIHAISDTLPPATPLDFNFLTFL